VLSVVFWITYVVYWRIVLRRGVEHEASLAFGLLALFAILQFAATQAWVTHNRRLARKHRGRRVVRQARPGDARTDFLGRSLRLFPAGMDLTTVPVIVVRTREREKWFEAELLLGEDVREA
jgi:membrane protease YdiL (CAAX protease family)